MKLPHGNLWKLPLCALCAAALTLSAWAAGPSAKLSGASEAETPTDNSALFYGYLLQRAGASDRASLLSDAGSKLAAKDKELYDLLKVWIAKIASGEETNAVYEIVYDDFQTTWTAAELGVSDCFSDEGKAAIRAKIAERYDYNYRAVMEALLADCPYEFYWYDKTEGYAVWGSPANYSGTRTQITLADAPTFSVEMSVSPDYGAETTVDISLHEGIESVVGNATAIVNKYADKSDYEKLLGYSTEICDLVSYDHGAAEDGDIPYGDPWQLINVFDGNPETNVVCEGYSKAFKYLCDLSQFSSPDVECYLVSGELSGGTGAGDHMWNVVTMENGKSYLVDVTNSDSNGGPAYLLLKGGSPDNADATQYTFYSQLKFLYDKDAVSLWGSELLTLDTADYQDAGAATPEPLKVGAYALSADGEAVSMDGLRDGANVVITADEADAESEILVFLAVYNGQGQMTDVQQWELSLSASAAPAASFQTQALPQGDSDAYAKFIILNANVKPLAVSATLK